MFSGLTDIGQRNAEFARRFLENERIELAGASLGGDLGRRIEFFPATGKARQVFLQGDRREEVVRAERQPPKLPAHSGVLELF